MDSSGTEDECDRPSIDTTTKESTLGSTGIRRGSGGGEGGDGGDGGGGVGGSGLGWGQGPSDAAVEQRGRGGEQLNLVALEPGQNIGPYRLQVRLLKYTSTLL